MVWVALHNLSIDLEGSCLVIRVTSLRHASLRIRLSTESKGNQRGQSSLVTRNSEERSSSCRLVFTMLPILLCMGCAQSQNFTNESMQGRAVELIYSDVGSVYMGGWTDDGRAITATSLRQSGPLPLLITVSSGIASELDIALPSAWAGEWKNDRMLLESDASGHPDIYVLDTDTNSISRVTTNPANEWHPSWDATGQSIIFDSDRIGQLDLFRVEMDSLTVTQLTADSSAEQVGRLSPDGEFLAFHRHQGQQDYDVIVMSMKTNAEYTLTDTSGDDSYPDWDPSGRFIAYSSNRSGTYGIYVMCATGKGTIQITGSGDKYPKWSPDGTSIAFQSNRDGALALYQIRSPKLPTCD